MRQKKKKTGTKRIENNQVQMFKKLYKKSVLKAERRDIMAANTASEYFVTYIYDT